MYIVPSICDICRRTKYPSSYPSPYFARSPATGLQRHIRRRSGTGTCDSGRACASHCSSRSLSAATVRKKSKRSSTRRWTRICLTLDPRNIALSTEIRAYARRRRARPSPRLAWLASCAAQLAAACTSSSANNKCR
jgi:hypothetical protein